MFTPNGKLLGGEPLFCKTPIFGVFTQSASDLFHDVDAKTLFYRTSVLSTTVVNVFIDKTGNKEFCRMPLVVINSTADVSLCCSMEVLSASATADGTNCFGDGSDDGYVSCKTTIINISTTDSLDDTIGNEML